MLQLSTNRKHSLVNNNPMYLLTIFGKNERANLSKAERNELAKLVDLLVQTALEKFYGKSVR